MILTANKGYATVVINKTDYVEEVEGQLSDKSVDQQLDSYPTKIFISKLEDIFIKDYNLQDISTQDFQLVINEKPLECAVLLASKSAKISCLPPAAP